MTKNTKRTATQSGTKISHTSTADTATVNKPPFPTPTPAGVQNSQYPYGHPLPTAAAVALPTTCTAQETVGSRLRKAENTGRDATANTSRPHVEKLLQARCSAPSVQPHIPHANSWGPPPQLLARPVPSPQVKCVVPHSPEAKTLTSQPPSHLLLLTMGPNATVSLVPRKDTDEQDRPPCTCHKLSSIGMGWDRPPPTLAATIPDMIPLVVGGR